MEDNSRLLFSAVWGGAVVMLSVVIIIARGLLLRKRRDRRAFRDFLQGAGFSLVGLASAVAIAAVIVAPDALNVRVFFIAMSLGAFVGALGIMAGDAISDLKRK